MKQPSRYIDLTTDYGFKRVFGTEVNKDLLIEFLNQLFRGRKIIKDLTYNKNEYQGDIIELGTVIFDLTCTADNGEQFIIEMQRSAKKRFKERTIYYGAKLLSDQAPKGDRKNWSYNISEVYVIVIMDDFTLTDKNDQYLHDICLCDRDTGHVFYDRLGFIYVELMNFDKQENELDTDLEKWLFVLKNMAKLDKLPTFLRKPIFEKLFNIAEYSNLSKGEKNMYDVSLKRKWDACYIREGIQMELQEAKVQGLEQGIQQGRLENMQETARKMLAKGFDTQTISAIIDLPVDEIKKLMQ
ncbi:Rpn family recombination-promoting nuclease/putative transposase [Lonepinella sp. BR2271]|uniref:Rpn family recombination-promoting nuclease/putative transposase n=1 Tax=Lonepinella sp. BR2271 TaxID=3434550 RepID=UPI003F6E2BE1